MAAAKRYSDLSRLSMSRFKGPGKPHANYIRGRVKRYTVFCHDRLIVSAFNNADEQTDEPAPEQPVPARRDALVGVNFRSGCPER